MGPIVVDRVKICPSGIDSGGMGVAPLLHLVGNIRDPGTNDETQPGVLDLLQVRLRHHPGIRDDSDLRKPMRGHELPRHRQDGGGLGGVAVEIVDLQREPANIGQQPDGDLRLKPAFLGNPDSRNPSPSSVSKYNVVTS